MEPMNPIEQEQAMPDGGLAAAKAALDAREKALDEREQALNLRERTLRAQALLEERGLPGEALAALDLASDEALDVSLQRAEALLKAANKADAPGAPRLTGPVPRADVRAMTYPERAALYARENARYHNLFKGEM